MPDGAKNEIEKKPENENLLSYEVLAQKNKELEAKIDALQKIVDDTKKVVLTNFTSSSPNEPKKSDTEVHEKLKKKLYSSLRLKTE